MIGYFMDCIFKTYGIVPKNHLCTNCAPLEQIFQSTGLNPKQAKKATKQTLTAYRILKLQDKIRDEPDPKKITAKLLCIPLLTQITKQTKQTINELNKTIQQIEKTNTNPTTYIQQIAKIGGHLLQNTTQQKQQSNQLNQIGQAIMAATITEDMIKDLAVDKQKGNFNPLKKANNEKIAQIKKVYSTNFESIVKPHLNIKKLKYNTFNRPKTILSTIGQPCPCCDSPMCSC